ncbi:MAG: Crp/Fnr family transcriptional regulator [Bacteroidetes bacterium]|nr:Crp/Fnr family transcriptional regulator [Bacteroidota bacterium]
MRFWIDDADSPNALASDFALDEPVNHYPLPITMFSPDLNLSQTQVLETPRFFDVIKKIGKAKRVKKGETIVREGSNTSFFVYILQGAFKTTVKTPRKNYILAFTFKDDIDCCPATLHSQHLNRFSIEAIVDSEVLICDFESLRKELGNEAHARWLTNLLAHYAIFLETQLIELLSLTAEERYKKLIRLQPEKMKLVPLSALAAYLGITLERLSRIRKKIRINHDS